MLLIYLSCAWVAGIFLGSRVNLPLALSLAGLVPLPLLLFFRQHRKPVILAGMMVFTLFTGAAYANTSLNTVSESSLRFYNDQGIVAIKGMVSGDPDVRDKNTHLKYSASEITWGERWTEVEGTALVFVPRYPVYGYGDVLLVTGELKTPPQFDDFDYRGYLAHQGIYATILYPKVELLDTGHGFKPLTWVYSLRALLAENLGRVLPEPQASLAQGIVLGMRGNIPLSLNNDFARSGTTHLLAISGLNLSVMAGILLSIGLWFFGRRHYLYIWLALGAIWFYVLITGVHPPVVRAALMASLFLMAEFLGRQRSAIVALTFSAAIMVGISPYLLGDAAFQLSFLAMAGLIFIAPFFRDRGRRVVTAWWGEKGIGTPVASIASDTLSATMGAIIAVWPVVAYHFGIISLAAPLATLLALPALSGIIVIGTLAAVLGLVALPLAQVLGWVAWLFLSYMITVVGGLGSPPASSIEGTVSIAFVWGYYLVLALAVWLGHHRKIFTHLMSGAAARVRSAVGAFNLSRAIKWVVPPLAIIAVLISYTAATMPDGNLRVSFLDVGEGDAILIQKGSQQVIIDGGSSPQAISLALSGKMPFWDRAIELVVLTHTHQDHLAGLLEVLRRYQVKQVLYTRWDVESPAYQEWLRLIAELGVPVTTARAGQLLNLGDGVVVNVLSPQIAFLGTESDIDNNSLVLRLSTGSISFLFTADIMNEAEWELISNRADLTSTVLKVAHHGSDTSTTPEFLAVVNPRVAVISVSADNRFGHPGDDVVSRLEQKLGVGNVYRTDRQGTIEFTTDGDRLWVSVAK
ncbi:MAG: DNA internalization-related competence protein ComEC/Rec2 [Chloroflexi bacterium RBG_16_50_9]|nr:MAG: DNA internalization-related competence protein ComEC/Rec2 [Chloroflexi bacterium RBG_16_50_9]